MADQRKNIQNNARHSARSNAAHIGNEKTEGVEALYPPDFVLTASPPIQMYRGGARASAAAANRASRSSSNAQKSKSVMETLTDFDYSKLSHVAMDQTLRGLLGIPVGIPGLFHGLKADLKAKFNLGFGGDIKVADVMGGLFVELYGGFDLKEDGKIEVSAGIDLGGYANASAFGDLLKANFEAYAGKEIKGEFDSVFNLAGHIYNKFLDVLHIIEKSMRKAPMVGDPLADLVFTFINMAPEANVKAPLVSNIDKAGIRGSVGVGNDDLGGEISGGMEWQDYVERRGMGGKIEDQGQVKISNIGLGFNAGGYDIAGQIIWEEKKSAMDTSKNEDKLKLIASMSKEKISISEEYMMEIAKLPAAALTGENIQMMLEKSLREMAGEIEGMEVTDWLEQSNSFGMKDVIELVIEWKKDSSGNYKLDRVEVLVGVSMNVKGEVSANVYGPLAMETGAEGEFNSRVRKVVYKP